MQINNLKIVYSKLYENWRVISPSGMVLEEFKSKEKAKKWAKETLDFVVKNSALKNTEPFN